VAFDSDKKGTILMVIMTLTMTVLYFGRFLGPLGWLLYPLKTDMLHLEWYLLFFQRRKHFVKKNKKNRSPCLNNAMKIKNNCVFFVLFVVWYFFAMCPTGIAAAENINWNAYEKGIVLGKNEGKMVFLHFYADWCFYCRKMAQETFQEPSVIAYLNDRFVSIRVDTDKDRKTASRYGVRALPSTWFLTEKGEKIGNIPGYISSKQFLELLKRLTKEFKKVPG
jgi:thioredoxin-related protein